MEHETTVNGYLRHNSLSFYSNKFTILPNINVKQDVFIKN